MGRNVTIERPEGGGPQLPSLAADLVRRQVTVIVATGIRPALAVKAATQTIPVVFGTATDPVEVGVVASLNRPSGNLTGVTSTIAELAGKRLELLHKLVPAADPIAHLSRISDGLTGERANLQSAARVLGVLLAAVRIRAKMAKNLTEGRSTGGAAVGCGLSDRKFDCLLPTIGL